MQNLEKLHTLECYEMHYLKKNSIILQQPCNNFFSKSLRIFLYYRRPSKDSLYIVRWSRQIYNSVYFLRVAIIFLILSVDRKRSVFMIVHVFQDPRTVERRPRATRRVARPRVPAKVTTSPTARSVASAASPRAPAAPWRTDRPRRRRAPVAIRPADDAPRSPRNSCWSWSASSTRRSTWAWRSART